MKSDKKNQDIIKTLDQEHDTILQKVDQLYEAANNLQFEGKVSFGKNMSLIEETIDYLKCDTYQHVKLEEEIVFVFLTEHMPKMEPLICFLRSDHKEFKSTLEAFESLFRKVQKEKDDLVRHKLIEQLRHKGTYLVCLIRSHVQTECESVYKSISEKLHHDEKEELFGKCDHFVAS